MHTLNSLKNNTGMLGGLWPIHLMRRSGAKGLMWALGGHFRRWRPWSAMVVLVDDDSWRLTSDQPTVGIIKNVYGSFFIYSYVDPIYS
jgi:hypothetical protein